VSSGSRFEAGEDYPTVWIAYNGNSDWNAHLEIKQVIPAPPRDVVSQQKKDAARAKANQQANWAAGLTVLAGGTCGYLPWEFCVAISAMAGAFQLDSNRLNNIANDPWDDNYQSPYEPQYHWYVVLWFSPLPTDGSAGWMGMAPWVNAYATYATVIDGLNDMTYVSANRSSSAWQVGDFGSSDMQYWRTQWGLQTAGQYYGYVAQDLWAFQWFFANYWDPYFDVGSGPKYLSESVGEMAQSYNELSSEFQQ
jgi:hypothetical protein